MGPRSMGGEKDQLLSKLLRAYVTCRVSVCDLLYVHIVKGYQPELSSVPQIGTAVAPVVVPVAVPVAGC